MFYIFCYVSYGLLLCFTNIVLHFDLNMFKVQSLPNFSSAQHPVEEVQICILFNVLDVINC